MLGHPRGLFVLFMTEMWERMSFYGMKALLILYLVNYLLWNQEDASTVMAWYAGLIYITPVFGGMLADKVFGARWSVVIGGVLMCIGHFLLAFEAMPYFYSGLGFLIAGCGLLKPNISTQVGSLYTPDDPRRDSAFTIFYMGINAGAFIAPIICGAIRLEYGFHYGFAAAGVGMAIGLVVYLVGMGSVVQRIKEVESIVAAKIQRSNSDASPVTEIEAPSRKVVRDRIIVLFIIFAFVIVFWMAFEQGANVMTIWADKNTNLYVFQGSSPEATIGVPAEQATEVSLSLWEKITTWSYIKNWKMGPEFLQAVNPFFIITLAGVFAWLWLWLDKRKLNPSTPAKMTIGMFGMTIAYVVMLAAAQVENKPSSAPLAVLPAGLELQADGVIYSIDPTEESEEGSATAQAGQPAGDEEANTTALAMDTTVVDENRIYYGCTRLKWNESEKALEMHGVLTDLDWLRVLSQTASAEYKDQIAGFSEEVEEAQRIYADKISEAKERARSATAEYTWTIDTQFSYDQKDQLPGRLNDLIGDMPWEKVDQSLVVTEKLARSEIQEQYLASIEPWSVTFTLPESMPEPQWAEALPEHLEWNAENRTLTATALLKEKDKLILLAAGADEEFTTAANTVYKDSSLLKISITWLILFYLCITVSELCLSPVGLSLVTKMAPAKHVGLFMGLWFVTTGGLANFSAHFIGGYWGKMTPTEYFMIFGSVALVTAFVMLMMVRFLKKRMHGIQ